jgi:hypothetical protein
MFGEESDQLWVTDNKWPLGTPIIVEKITEITVREYRRGNTNGQSRANGNIGYTRRRKTKQKHSICVGQLYAQTSTNNLYVAPMLKSSLQILFSRHHKMVDHYEISMDLLLFTWMFSFLYYCQDAYRT